MLATALPLAGWLMVTTLLSVHQQRSTRLPTSRAAALRVGARRRCSQSPATGCPASTAGGPARVPASRGRVARGSSCVCMASGERSSGNTEPRRVVITGMGVVSCLGHEIGSFYDALLEGRSGVTHIERFDATDYATRIAGEIKHFVPEEKYMNKKLARRLDDCIKYLIVAGRKSLEHAGLGTDDAMAALDKKRCGVLIGSAMGGMGSFAGAVEDLEFRGGVRKMSPFCIPSAITNMGSALLAMDPAVGFMGPNYSISTACATGNFCLLNAANHIKSGEADVMLAGGSDAAVIPSGVGGFVACKALSRRNDAPAAASRPWDRGRDGFVMGEGAGVLVMEELGHALRRGAVIHAEFLGGAYTCDAHHMTEPHPAGAGVMLCVERALAASGASREAVNYVNAHGTSTLAGDMAEYRALASCFPQTDLRLNSTKSVIGHLLGAAGAVEAVATVQAISTGWLHPTLNLDDPEPGVDTTRIVHGTKQRMDVRVALSNSFGFGGHNSAILFAPYKA